MGAARNLGAPQMLVHTDDFEHDAAIVRPVALGIGADGDALAQNSLAAAVHDLRPSEPLLIRHGQCRLADEQNNSSRLFY
ncbi:hypothetical protein D9M72_643950 [compost metagenome]